MAVKNGGYTTGAVVALALWEGHCTSRSCVQAGWVQIDSWHRHTAYCIRDCSGNPFLFQKRLQRKARPVGECPNNCLYFPLPSYVISAHHIFSKLVSGKQINLLLLIFYRCPVSFLLALCQSYNYRLIK